MLQALPIIVDLMPVTETITTTSRVDTFEQLNPQLVKLVRDKLPIYEIAPTESEEANMTSIQYFKKHFDAYLRGEIFPLLETF